MLRTIPLTAAVTLAVDEQTSRVFVVRSLGIEGSTSTLDARSGSLLRTVSIGSFPVAVVVDTVSGHAFVSSDRGVSILDALTGRIVHVAYLTGHSNQMTVAERAGYVFVLNRTGATGTSLIRMVNARTGRVVRTVAGGGVGFSPLAAAEHAGRVFVTNDMSNSVSMLDAHTGAVLRTVRVGQSPQEIATDEQAGHVFVVNNGGISSYEGSVSMLDARTGTVLRTTPINHNPLAIGVDSQTGRVFVTTLYTIDVLDARSGALVHSLNVPVIPSSAPVVNPRTGHVLDLLARSLDAQGNATGPAYLLVLDGSTGAVRQRIATGGAGTELVTQVAVDGRANRVFVLDATAVDMFDAARL